MIKKSDVTLLKCEKCNIPTFFPIHKVNELLRVGFYCHRCRVTPFPVKRPKE